MTLEANAGQTWMKELQDFISHWEQESEEIKERKLNQKECFTISESFQRDRDGLLARRPVGLSDEEVLLRLKPLDGKLNSSLAMALSSTPDKNIMRP
jgi:hypothetical protein